MNDLFSSSSFSFSHPADDDDHRQPPSSTTIELSSLDLDPFFSDADTIKRDLKRLDALRRSLASSHENSKTAHDPKAVKELRSQMDSDVAEALKTAKLVKVRLEALDRSNKASLRVPGHQVGSDSERTRTSVVNGLRNKLGERIQEFNELRGRIREEYRETVGRRYFAVTGEMLDARTLDTIISTGQSESFLQKAIQQQGRGRVMDAIVDIQERNDTVKDLERNLEELHEVFKDLAVLVEAQDGELDDIESQVNRAHTFVRRGTESLQSARSYLKNTRKWIFLATVLLLVIVLLIVLFVVKP